MKTAKERKFEMDEVNQRIKIVDKILDRAQDKGAYKVSLDYEYNEVFKNLNVTCGFLHKHIDRVFSELGYRVSDRSTGPRTFGIEISWEN